MYSRTFKSSMPKLLHSASRVSHGTVVEGLGVSDMTSVLECTVCI